MKRRSTKKEMYEKIRSWEASGESQTSYFEKQGISRHRYEYWLKKYRKEAAPAAKFIEVKPPQHLENRAKEPGNYLARLRFTDGRWLEFGSGASVEFIKKVIGC